MNGDFSFSFYSLFFKYWKNLKEYLVNNLGQSCIMYIQYKIKQFKKILVRWELVRAKCQANHHQAQIETF